MPGVYNAKFRKLPQNYMSEMGSGDGGILLLKNRGTNPASLINYLDFCATIPFTLVNRVSKYKCN